MGWACQVSVWKIVYRSVDVDGRKAHYLAYRPRQSRDDNSIDRRVRISPININSELPKLDKSDLKIESEQIYYIEAILAKVHTRCKTYS